MRLKIITVIVLAVFAATIQAQTATADSTKKSDLKYRAEAGYGQLYRYGDAIVKSPYHTIRTGLKIEIPIRFGFGVETGLDYSYVMGRREQLYAHSDTAFFKYSGHLLDIPVRLTYTLPIFWGLKLFAYGGPNISIGLAQTSDVRFTPKKTDVPNPIAGYPVPGTYDLYQTEMKRVAFQLGTGGGIQWKNLRLRSGYDWGLNNIGKSKNYREGLRGWHVAFEYEF